MLSLKITIWAIIFIITNGAVFADYFKDNKILSALSGLFAVISSYYLFGDIEKDIEHISGYKFLLYVLVVVIIFFTIVHSLKSQEQSETRGGVGNFFNYLFTVMFLGVVVFGGLYLLDSYIKSEDVTKGLKYRVDRDSFENIPILEEIPKKGTFESTINYNAKVDKIMNAYNNKLQQITFLAGKAMMVSYDADSKIATVKVIFKDGLLLGDFIEKLSLEADEAKGIFGDINQDSNLYFTLFASKKDELFV